MNAALIHLSYRTLKQWVFLYSALCTVVLISKIFIEKDVTLLCDILLYLLFQRSWGSKLVVEFCFYCLVNLWPRQIKFRVFKFIYLTVAFGLGKCTVFLGFRLVFVTKNEWGLFTVLSQNLCIVPECVSENSCQECIIFKEISFFQNCSTKYYLKEECRANTCWGRRRKDACGRSLCSHWSTDSLTAVYP